MELARIKTRLARESPAGPDGRPRDRPAWARLRRSGLGALLAALAVELVDELVDGTKSAAMPLIRHDLALSYLQIGLLAAVPLLVGSILELPVGVISGSGSRRRRFVLAGGLVFIASVLAAGLASSFLGLLLALTIFFPASGMFVSLTQAALMDAAPDRRAAAHGLVDAGRLDRRRGRPAAGRGRPRRRRQLAAGLRPDRRVQRRCLGRCGVDRSAAQRSRRRRRSLRWERGRIRPHRRRKRGRAGLARMANGDLRRSPLWRRALAHAARGREPAAGRAHPVPGPVPGCRRARLAAGRCARRRGAPGGRPGRRRDLDPRCWRPATAGG